MCCANSRVYSIVGAARQPVVLLQHGLMQSAGIFVCNEEESLAFWLAERGFDVWLGNNRGFCPHRDYSPCDQRYWDWGLDELALRDVPAMIMQACTVSGAERLVYIGHSQGSAIGFACFSAMPEIARRVSLFVAMAPAYYVGEKDIGLG